MPYSKEKQREYYNRWRKKNMEKLNEKSKKWQRENKEKVNAYLRKRYHEQHPDARYYAKSRENIRKDKYPSDNEYNHKQSYSWEWFGKRFKDLSRDERAEYNRRVCARYRARHCS